MTDLHSVRERYLQARAMLGAPTTESLQEAVRELASVLGEMPSAVLRAWVHQDLAIGHMLLVEIEPAGRGHDARLAVDHSTQACRLRVNHVFAEGAADELTHCMKVLAGALRLPGVDPPRLRAAQEFLDRYQAMLRELSAYSDVQQAIGDGYLVLLDGRERAFRHRHANDARMAFDRAAELLAGAEDADRFGLLLANRALLGLLVARNAGDFHRALDDVFAAEELVPGLASDGVTLRKRVLLCLLRSDYRELPQADRWRVRIRCWERWAADWLRGVEQPEPDPTAPPRPSGDWLGLMIGLEDDDWPATQDLTPDLREYVGALVTFAGYPVGLAVVLTARRLDGRFVPPDELLDRPGVLPADLMRLAAFCAAVRDAVVSGQRGDDGLTPLMSLYDALPNERRDRTAIPFFVGCLELALAGTIGDRWEDLTSFAYELAMRLSEDLRLPLMTDAWAAFSTTVLAVRNHRIGAAWTGELVRLAEQAQRADASSHATHLTIRALIEQAKVLSLIEDDIDDVIADLERRVEDLRIADTASATADLYVGLLRLRARVAIERDDAPTALACYAECVATAAVHPDWGLGKRVPDAVNLVAVVAEVPESWVEPVAAEVAAAARLMLDNVGRVLGLGHHGRTALAQLTTLSHNGVIRLDAEDIRLVTLTVRGEQAEASPLGPAQRSLAETMEIGAQLQAQGREQHAVGFLVEWLLLNNDRLIHDRRARLLHCVVAMTLVEYAARSESCSEALRLLTRYAAGEAARHAGLRDFAREHLTAACEGLAALPDPPIPPSMVEYDRTMLMIESAAQDGDHDAALYWLDALFANPCAGSPDGLTALAHGLLLVVRAFGPEESTDRVAGVLAALAEVVEPDDDRGVMRTARATMFRADLLLALGDTAALPALVPELSALAASSPPALEPFVRRSIVGCLVALGDVAGLRAELNRLSFLQDEAIGVAVRFDDHSYVDYIGSAQLLAASAALGDGDVEAAVDLLEQGRLRLLRRLRAGIVEEADLALSDDGPDDFWEVMAGIAVQRPATAFGVPMQDWEQVFRDAGVDEAATAAERAGVVAYQVVHADRLRMVYLLRGRTALMVGPLDVPEASGEADDDLCAALGRGWESALRACLDSGMPADEVQPVLISAGGGAKLTVLNERAYRVASRIHPGTAGVLNHLPSVRFAGTRADTKPPPTRLLHIGDKSNTLLGPWLEAAALADVSELAVRSLLGAESTELVFARHLPDAQVIVASCHGVRRRELFGSSLLVGADGLSILDIATKYSLSHVDMLFLASCEMGRRLDEHYDRESLSFSNAALVSGCRHVVAPVLPVDDLLSSVLVDEFARRLTKAGSVQAYRQAVDVLHDMGRDELADRVHAMWERLSASSLAGRMPWPRKVAFRILEQLTASAFQNGTRSLTFSFTSV